MRNVDHILVQSVRYARRVLCHVWAQRVERARAHAAREASVVSCAGIASEEGAGTCGAHMGAVSFVGTAIEEAPYNGHREAGAAGVAPSTLGYGRQWFRGEGRLRSFLRHVCDV